MVRIFNELTMKMLQIGIDTVKLKVNFFTNSKPVGSSTLRNEISIDLALEIDSIDSIHSFSIAVHSSKHSSMERLMMHMDGKKTERKRPNQSESSIIDQLS